MSDQWSIANLQTRFNWEEFKDSPDGPVKGRMVSNTTYELRRGGVTLWCNRSHWDYTSIRPDEVVRDPKSPYIVVGPDGKVCDFEYPEMPDETRALLESAAPFAYGHWKSVDHED